MAKKIEDKPKTKSSETPVEVISFEDAPMQFTGNPGSFNPGSAPRSDKEYLGPTKNDAGVVVEGSFGMKDLERPEFQRAIQDGNIFLDAGQHARGGSIVPGVADIPYDQLDDSEGANQVRRRRAAFENLLAKYR